MVRQLIVHDKQFRFCIFMCQNLWNQKTGHQIAQTVEYLIWWALQQLVYHHGHIWDIEQLKEVVQTCWEQIGQDIIDRAIGQFHKWLSLVVTTTEGHIEQRFD